MFRDDLMIGQINQIKRLIIDFITTLTSYAKNNNAVDLIQSDKDFFTFLSKQIIFLKNIYQSCSNYNIKVLISDLYNYIICIIKNEHRYIYVNERSIIENYTRWIVGVDVEVNHITNQSFELLKNKSYLTPLTDDEFSLIKNEYTTSCGYIHGSKLLDDNLSFVFNDCISNFIMFKNKSSYYQRIIYIIKIYNRLLISTYPNMIDSAFYRRKSVLKYLIGEEQVNYLFNFLN